MSTFENQIEQRRNLLSYFISQKAEATINNLPTDAWDKLINIVTSQLMYLISSDIDLFFNTDLSTSNYQTAEGVKRESALKNLEEAIKKEGFLPFDINPTENKILVIDYNTILPEYKDVDVEELRQYLEGNYGCKVLLIDTSRYNTQGSSLIKMPSPIFFI